MKTALWVNALSWWIVGFVGVIKDSPDCFQWLAGGWMCIGFSLVIQAIEKKR